MPVTNPVSDQIKQQRGTFRKDRAKDSFNSPGLDYIPEPPIRFQNQSQKEAWRIACEDLKDRGVLWTVSLDLISIYVDANTLYFDSLKGMADSKEKISTLKIWLKIKNDASKQMLILAKEFGFTPSTRDKVAHSISKPESKNDPDFNF